MLFPVDHAAINKRGSSGLPMTPARLTPCRTKRYLIAMSPTYTIECHPNKDHRKEVVPSNSKNFAKDISKDSSSTSRTISLFNCLKFLESVSIPPERLRGNVNQVYDIRTIFHDNINRHGASTHNRKALQL
ncbi:hypothetical protein CEXT_135251 [Caerostris extrusa]|uniref:Uncharacterized protein n=1 Tax=Caerostris extrusa TaxID=172846 RepID=A0AAV4P1B3_CAEEX|nr:hypothetical protein CEXT_135251 [Caerostris extrusa]